VMNLSTKHKWWQETDEIEYVAPWKKKRITERKKLQQLPDII
jgi:hypothetical protein